MFRIQRSTDGKLVVFALSGRIKTESVDELQKLFESEVGNPTVVLDLKEVRLVDRDAICFLVDCESKGIKLAHCPAYVREWIQKEALRTEESKTS